MANPFFEFKKFTIHHDKCAMKVGTDGVLLGAWSNIEGASALDIGTGSGLISLMLAQRNGELKIDAIDTEISAIEQASENVNKSIFKDRINCIHSSLQEYVRLYNKRYDCIVSNPPFFNNSLKSPNEERTLARHTDSLTLPELIKLGSSLLSNNGNFSLIYPHENFNELKELARKNNLFVTRLTHVLPTPESNPKRILIEYAKQEVLLQENSLILEKTRHVYSDEFNQLVKDFYLKL